jgi:hypothetical protein
MTNGYTEHHPIGLTAEAQMLESAAGYTVARVRRELGYAIQTLERDDPDSLRWLVCLCARRVDDIEAARIEAKSQRP